MIKTKISSKKLRGHNPYIIDRFKLCIVPGYPNAVYIEDESGNKYAVNGNAMTYLQQIRDKRLKGYTTLILKEGDNDVELMTRGFKMYKEYKKQKPNALQLFVLFVHFICCAALYIVFVQIGKPSFWLIFLPVLINVYIDYQRAGEIDV